MALPIFPSVNKSVVSSSACVLRGLPALDAPLDLSRELRPNGYSWRYARFATLPLEAESAERPKVPTSQNGRCEPIFKNGSRTVLDVQAKPSRPNCC